MKATAISKPKTFEPVTLEITIETEDELRTLYSFANAGRGVASRSLRDDKFHIKSLDEATSTSAIYEVLKLICEERL